MARTRLHERLRAGRNGRLTTVVAPAGWGKTTLLAAWADDREEKRPVGWLSIDEADDEPVRFWTYALSAPDAVAPHLARDALAALTAPGLDPLGVALSALLNALTAETDRYVLVLDDYHVLSDPAIHEGVEYLLAYLPPALHLVIAGRADRRFRWPGCGVVPRPRRDGGAAAHGCAGRGGGARRPPVPDAGLRGGPVRPARRRRRVAAGGRAGDHRRRRAADRAWGDGAAAAAAVLRLAEGRLVAARDPATALPLLYRAVEHAEGWARPTVLIAALTSLAAAQWAAGDRSGARSSIDRAHEVGDVESARPLPVRQLDELESRIGRRATGRHATAACSPSR